MWAAEDKQLRAWCECIKSIGVFCCGMDEEEFAPFLKMQSTHYYFFFNLQWCSKMFQEVRRRLHKNHPPSGCSRWEIQVDWNDLSYWYLEVQMQGKEWTMMMITNRSWLQFMNDLWKSPRPQFEFHQTLRINYPVAHLQSKSRNLQMMQTLINSLHGSLKRVLSLSFK